MVVRCTQNMHRDGNKIWREKAEREKKEEKTWDLCRSHWKLGQFELKFEHRVVSVLWHCLVFPQVPVPTSDRWKVPNRAVPRARSRKSLPKPAPLPPAKILRQQVSTTFPAEKGQQGRCGRLGRMLILLIQAVVIWDCFYHTPLLLLVWGQHGAVCCVQRPFDISVADIVFFFYGAGLFQEHLCWICQQIKFLFCLFVLGQPVSNLVFYAQSTLAVLSGRFDNQKFGEKHGKVVLNNVVCPWFMCFLWGLDH